MTSAAAAAIGAALVLVIMLASLANPAECFDPSTDSIVSCD